ncbi:type II CAAX endopeptidase family protein [Methylocaldum sp. RMAD-M]|jgi:membrane protease YdiL (CAAX protease family)|uniref:CPBP family intramembrane glutamic endopeptidase n=1 Tax=Methylocaldum sp. RMAD-M TaxID=2806557 RepID=UPI001AE712DB|nr:type II CAAX endopeptidase family protein [Methylocaldum sp. RMAD-M]MBP1151826.1 membrane protease YdiL (CAAX protease family) [Methylocaldum sp. RMAD-M]
MNGESYDNSGAHREHRIETVDKKTLLFEVSVFLSLIVPSMVLSFFAVRQGALTFTVTAWATMLRDLALVGLIAYFLRRNGEPTCRLGWTFTNARTEVGIGLALFIPFFVGMGVLENSLRAAGFSMPSTPLPTYLRPESLPQSVLATLLVAVVAIAEETIFRGYLILRFKGLGASSAGAVALSAFIFSLGHGYEGSAGVITVGAAGLIFGMIYLWRRSLVGPVVLHFLLDFIGIVLAPMLRP